MSKPRKPKLSLSGLVGQSKILISQPPGRTAMLLHDGTATPMQFAGATAALAWAEEQRVAFFYMPSEPVAKN